MFSSVSNSIASQPGVVTPNNLIDYSSPVYAPNTYNNGIHSYSDGGSTAGDGATSQTPIATRLYQIKKGETVGDIAKRFNLTVTGLARLNETLFFPKGFDQVKAGDKIYIPITPVSDDMADYLNSGTSPNSLISSYLVNAGNFFANNGDSEQLRSMATGYAAGRVNNVVNQWFSKYGTANFQFNIDNEFSTKNSQFAFLLPLYDKGNKLFFTQTSIHRTDDRTQSNLGLGYRYFTDHYMVGLNAFWDYDMSRSSPAGSDVYISDISEVSVGIYGAKL